MMVTEDCPVDDKSHAIVTHLYDILHTLHSLTSVVHRNQIQATKQIPAKI